jgi:hypothetical protein
MELSTKAKNIVARLSAFRFDVNGIPTDVKHALSNMIDYSLPCSLVAVPMIDKAPRIGDVLVGFYAFEDVEFILKVDALLPTYLHKLYHSTEPVPFTPLQHKIAKNTFVYAYTKDGDDYVVNMIGMQYSSIFLEDAKVPNSSNLVAIFAFLQTNERLNIAESGQTMFRVCPSLENRMASKIQKQWRESISNPNYIVCKRRLKHEASSLIL